MFPVFSSRMMAVSPWSPEIENFLPYSHDLLTRREVVTVGATPRTPCERALLLVA